jgi:hypothetical protein
MSYLPPLANGLFRSIAHSKNANWFVRQQAILTIGWFCLASEARALGRLLATEWDDEVRRAIIAVLFLLAPMEEKQVLRRSSRDLAVKVSRMSNYALRLRSDAQFAQAAMKQFKQPNEVFFADCFWRLYQIRWNKDPNTKRMLNRILDDGIHELSSKYAKSHLRSCRPR